MSVKLKGIRADSVALKFTTLQFSKFEEIFKRGYKTATKILQEWKEANNLPTGSDEGFKETEKRKKGRGLRRNSI